MKNTSLKSWEVFLFTLQNKSFIQEISYLQYF